MPTRIGPRPGSPVTDIRPLMPWTIWSTPGMSLYGPSCPKAEMLAKMMRGFLDLSVS